LENLLVRNDANLTSFINYNVAFSTAIKLIIGGVTTIKKTLDVFSPIGESTQFREIKICVVPQKITIIAMF
jgi:hypothetical protein